MSFPGSHHVSQARAKGFTNFADAMEAVQKMDQERVDAQMLGISIEDYRAYVKDQEEIESEERQAYDRRQGELVAAAERRDQEFIEREDVR